MPNYRTSIDEKLEPEIRRVFRENLRKRRYEKGLKQRELGDRIGCNQQFVQQMESPKSDVVPRLEMLEKIARALDTTPAALLTPGRFDGKLDGTTDLRTLRSMVT